MAQNIALIIGSTRQNRKGEIIAQQIASLATESGQNLSIIDLKQENLPFMDAGMPPSMAPVDTPEAKAWAEKIAGFDGFVFLTAEYNRGVPAPLKNAVDYLVKEWEGKPAAIVSYGFVDGGASAAKHLTDSLQWLKMNVVASVALPFSRETFTETGEFVDAAAFVAGSKEGILAALADIAKA